MLRLPSTITPGTKAFRVVAVEQFDPRSAALVGEQGIGNWKRGPSWIVEGHVGQFETH
jgi:hypothetical protein